MYLSSSYLSFFQLSKVTEEFAAFAAFYCPTQQCTNVPDTVPVNLVTRIKTLVSYILFRFNRGDEEEELIFLVNI